MALPKKLLIAILALACVKGAAEYTCSDDDLKLLEQRVKCQMSNTPKNCSPLLAMGALGGVRALARLGKLSPRAAAYEAFFKELNKTQRQLLSSYKTTVDVFYEHYNKLPNKSLKVTREFGWHEYAAVKDQMDHDPRLKNNAFMTKFREEIAKVDPGQQHELRAQDVIGRDILYAKENVKKIFDRLGTVLDSFEVMDSFKFAAGRGEAIALQIFAAASLKAGHPENGAPDNERIAKLRAAAGKDAEDTVREKDLDEQRRRSGAGLREQSREVPKRIHDEDVASGAFKEVPGSSRGVVKSVDAMASLGMVAAGAGALARSATVLKCANEWKIPLSKTETIEVAWHADAREASYLSCDQLELQTSITEMLSKPLSPNVREFLCRMAEKTGKRQDEVEMMAQEVAQQVIDNPKCGKIWTIPTSKGSVSVELDSIGEWNYGRFKADNKDFDDYLRLMAKDPNRNLYERAKTITPLRACTAAAQGASEKAFCELTKELFSYGVMRNAHQDLCAINAKFGLPKTNDRSTSSDGTN